MNQIANKETLPSVAVLQGLLHGFFCVFVKTVLKSTINIKCD